MTSSKQNFQNLRKVSSQIFVKTMWSKFQQNRSKNVEIKGPDRHKYTHTLARTHRHTDRDRPGTTYSVLKWLNIKTKRTWWRLKLYISRHSDENCGLGCTFYWKILLWPLFLTEITVKFKNHGYIRNQQAKIYKKPWFVFDFTSPKVLTVFINGYFDRMMMT